MTCAHAQVSKKLKNKNLQDTLVTAIMKPRVEIVAVEASTNVQTFVRAVSESGYSRIPVYFLFLFFIFYFLCFNLKKNRIVTVASWYVYMYISLCISLCVSLCISICVSRFVCICVCMYICLYVYLSV